MKGTYWYHSHIGAQRSNGAFGALIIKERQKENASSPRDMIATVGDWHHLHSSEVGNYEITFSSFAVLILERTFELLSSNYKCI